MRSAHGRCCRRRPAVHDGWLVWEVPGKPVSVRVSPDAQAASQWRSGKELRRFPGGSGNRRTSHRLRKKEGGNPLVVEVDDFEPVESEHAAGPSYVLSEGDLRNLKARIAARGVARSTTIVGFYRSHTRPDFAITMEDASLFSSYFREPSDVFLLIKPNEGGPFTAGFIIRESGKVVSDSPYVQFPLAETIGETPFRAFKEPQAPPRGSDRPTSAAEADHLDGEATDVAGIRRCRGFGRMLFPGNSKARSGSIPVKPGPPVALNVTNIGNSLRVSWDRPSTRIAAKAILWIKDGQEMQRFELDSKQLSEGSVVYWPTHSDVDFRFELLSAGASVTESVRAIGGPSKGRHPGRVALEGQAVSVPFRKPPHKKRLASQVSPSTAPRRNGVVPASRQLSGALRLRRPEHGPAAAALASLPDPP